MAYKPVLTKSKYMVGLKCKRSLWIMFNRKDLIPEVDEFTQFRFDQGLVIGELAKKFYPNGIDIQCEDFVKNLEESKELLTQRVPLFEAGFMYDGCFSRADFLIPVNQDEWDIVEVKSSTSVKDDHINDLAFQKYCYEKNGIKIRRAYLMHVNNQYVRNGDLEIDKLLVKEDISSEVEKYMDGIEDRILEMYEVINSKSYDEKKWGKHCNDYSICPMPDIDWGEITFDSPLNLYYSGARGVEFFDKGLKISDLNESEVKNEKQKIQIRCSKNKSEHIDILNVKNFLNSLKYPLFFLDFETYSTAIPNFDKLRPYQQIPFQFSCHIIDFPGLPPRQVHFLSKDKNDPRFEFLEFLKKTIKPNGSIIIYHQGFEKSILRNLIDFSPNDEFFIEDMISRFVDLIEPFKSFSYYNYKQDGSCSLKSVYPALVDNSYNGLDIKDGETASLCYSRTILDNTMDEFMKKKIFEDLEKYCSLDTLAMIKIIEKLKEKLNNFIN